MPTLNWIGKEKIVNHDKEVPFRLLKKNKKLSLGKSENLIVEGDNLEALKALMPFYHNSIKCIYIDPPYNTGNEKWVYNDKVNSPKIKEWLGKAVGPEGEDLTRHDKWLCMMYSRIELLYDLLSNNGVIFISIDDNEIHNLRIIMDDIFGQEYFLGNITWIKRTKPVNSGKARLQLQQNVEYILCYSKTKRIDYIGFRLKVTGQREYNQKGKLGKCRFIDIEDSDYGWKKRETMKFPILGVSPGTGKRWKIGEEEVNRLVKNNRIEIIGGKIKVAIYPEDEKDSVESPFWSHLDLKLTGTAETGKTELSRILGKAHNFDTVKPVSLIKELLSHFEDGVIILDSFAGSGTTGHAVLELNKEDGGNRKFILVEMEKNICRDITSERIRRVSQGYSYKKNGGEAVKVEGLGGGFEYVELGDTLFNSDGTINEAVSFEDMARYVFFTETHTNLDKSGIKGNYLGEFADTSYFLLFDGIGKNVLDRRFLKELKTQKGGKVVYADKCLLDEDILEKHRIVFKQIPYQVKVY